MFTPISFRLVILTTENVVGNRRKIIQTMSDDRAETKQGAVPKIQTYLSATVCTPKGNCPDLSAFDYSMSKQFVDKADANVDWSQFLLLSDSQDSAGGFLVPKNAKVFSGMMSAMMDDDATDSNDVMQFGCNRFHKDVIFLVARWLSYFAANEQYGVAPTQYKQPFTEKEMVGCSFEMALIKDHMDTTTKEGLLMNIAVMNVANYLQLNALGDFCCVNLTMRLRGRTPPQISELFVGLSLPQAKEE